MKFDMKIRLIKNEKMYKEYLDLFEALFNQEPKKGTDKGDELELLSILIENYEIIHFPVEMPSPIEAIKYRMEQLGMKQKDLTQFLGFGSRVSEVLNNKRKLTIEMIRKLNKNLGIPSEVLIQDY